MSLFKAREWWSTTSGYEEFHDTGCLCVANIDNNTAGHGMMACMQLDMAIYIIFGVVVPTLRQHTPAMHSVTC